MNTFNALKADVHRQYANYSIWRLMKGISTSRTFRVVATMRLCKIVGASRGIFRYTLPFFQIMHRIATPLCQDSCHLRIE